MIFNIEEKNTQDWLKNHFPSKDSFFSDLGQYYKYIRGYHATKIYDFDNFSKGLIPASDEFIKQRAKKLFKLEDSYYNSIIDEVIDSSEIYSNGELHYTIHKNSFIRSKHYLYFGSENLIKITDNIKSRLSSVSFRQILINSGQPAIIHLNIRIENLSNLEKEELFDFFKDLEPEEIDDIPNIGSYYSFIHKKVVECIAKIEFVDRPINDAGWPDY